MNTIKWIALAVSAICVVMLAVGIAKYLFTGIALVAVSVSIWTVLSRRRAEV